MQARVQQNEQWRIKVKVSGVLGIIKKIVPASEHKLGNLGTSHRT